MALRREIRKFYGLKHRKLRAQLIELLGNFCQRCKQPHPRLNLAHLKHDPTDTKSVTLLCPSCHARIDTPQRVAMTRRTRARRRGQLWLSLALEWAPYAGWEIPEHLRDAATQIALFQ
jgi:hypothetical protein